MNFVIQGKKRVRENQGTRVPKSQGKSGNFGKTMGGKPKGMSHNSAEFAGVKACFLRVK